MVKQVKLLVETDPVTKTSKVITVYEEELDPRLGEIRTVNDEYIERGVANGFKREDRINTVIEICLSHIEGIECRIERNQKEIKEKQNNIKKCKDEIKEIKKEYRRLNKELKSPKVANNKPVEMAVPTN